MKKKKKAKLIVATHKQYESIPLNNLYLPIQVGAELNKGKDLGYQKDNVGDNISDKNDRYSELTALYWAWKHVDAEYIGLVHYRRHFGGKNYHHGKDRLSWVITKAELEPMLDDYDVILPKKRRYYIETLYSHYEHTHYSNQLDVTFDIIKEKYPEYADTYEKVINKTSGYMFNMVIMRKDLLDAYCTWLFDILFELEKRLGTQNLDAFQQRFYGRVSEIIFNVWLEKQFEDGVIDKKRVIELPVVYLEEINFSKKLVAFLMAKFLGRKYQHSF